MNIIPFPTVPRKNPNWLLRMARQIGRLRQFSQDYWHFRRRGMSNKAAFFNAKNTVQLPMRLR